jgi:hypothetical protein
VTNGQFSGKGAPLGGACLLKFTQRGYLRVVAQDTRWLNYPTAVVVNPFSDHQTLFLENGAFYGGTANILRLR